MADCSGGSAFLLLITNLFFISPQCQIRFGGRKEIASDSDSRSVPVPVPVHACGCGFSKWSVYQHLCVCVCVCVCRVICLCAQFEAVLQHGLRKTRGLALTAAALKQVAGFSSKTEGGTG